MVRIRMHLLARQVDCAKAKELQIRPSVWQGSIGAAAALSLSLHPWITFPLISRIRFIGREFRHKMVQTWAAKLDKMSTLSYLATSGHLLLKPQVEKIWSSVSATPPT